MKTEKDIFDAIESRADKDGQFAVAWALCLITVEARGLMKALVGDFSGPGVLSDPMRLERVSLAIESVASAITEVSAEMGQR